MNTRTRWLLKLCAGIILGISLALILGAGYVRLSITLGIVCTIAGALMSWRNRGKIVSCFLASCMVTAAPDLRADDFYAGYNGNQCYCFSAAADGPQPEQHVFMVDFILEADDLGQVQPRVISVRHPEPSALVSYQEMNESLAAWGLNLDGGMQYAKNGQPSTADQMPFVFGDWTAPLAVYPERVQYRVVIEVATELGEFALWQPVAHFSAPVGVRIQTQDSPDGPQAFYRIRLERAPENFQAAGPVLLGCGLGLLAGSAVICVLSVRACAKNKSKFEKMLPPKGTNVPPAELYLK